MRISVLMSVYKSEKPAYLNRSLQSVWDDQTLRPDEIVLIKDGSLSDGLNQIIDDWQEKLGDRLVVLTNETNLGLTKSLNKGLKVVKGEYIARMDSDDISSPNRFRLQAEYLDSHPDIAVVGGSLQEFDSEHECLNIRHYPLTNEDAKSTIHKANPLAHSTVMIRRIVFDKGHHYDERYRKNQDLALWFTLLSNGFKIANLPQVLVNFRRSDDVYTRRSSKSAQLELQIYFRGIYKLYGVCTPKYIFPLMRFIFRFMPKSLVKKVYGSKLRNKMTN